MSNAGIRWTARGRIQGHVAHRLGPHTAQSWTRESRVVLPVTKPGTTVTEPVAEPVAEHGLGALTGAPVR